MVCSRNGCCEAGTLAALVLDRATITRWAHLLVGQRSRVCVCKGTFCSVLGKYIYLETSSPSTSGQKANLASSVPIDPSCSSCKLKFWYHMYGNTINTLNIYMKPTTGVMKTIWSKSGNQGNQWSNATVSLTSSVSYQIIFEAVAGSSYTGDIAVDDITFENCPPAPTPTPPPPCSPSNVLFLFYIELAFISYCNFGLQDLVLETVISSKTRATAVAGRTHSEVTTMTGNALEAQRNHTLPVPL